MNNTTPIKILTAAVLLTFGFALTANAALINKGVSLLTLRVVDQAGIPR